MEHLQVDRIFGGPVHFHHERELRRGQARFLAEEHPKRRHWHGEPGGIADVWMVALQAERLGMEPVGLPQTRLPLEQRWQQGRIAPA